MSYRGLLNSTVSIHRDTTSRDAAGGVTRSWASIYDGVPARIQPMSGSEAVTARRREGSAMWRIYVEPSKAITTRDRVVWTDPEGVTRTADVTEASDFQQAGVGVRLICEEIM